MEKLGLNSETSGFGMEQAGREDGGWCEITRVLEEVCNLFSGQQKTMKD